MEFTTIIGLVAIALCIIPFRLMHKSKKKRQTELVDGLRAVADSYNCELAALDCGIEFSIGISSAKNYVYFYKKSKETITEQCVPLKAIRKCQVETKKRSVKATGDAEAVIDRLELAFIPRDNSIAPSRFVFFDSDEHSQLNGEFPLIKKWENIVNNSLRENSMQTVRS